MMVKGRMKVTESNVGEFKTDGYMVNGNETGKYEGEWKDWHEHGQGNPILP